MASLGAVLVLEDDYLLAAAIAGFVADAGYCVIGPVPGMEQAQHLINERGIVAALLDIRLGSDDRSFELAARLQAMRVPFAFVTGYPRLLPIAFQNIACIGKPLSREELEGVLSKIVGNTRSLG